MRLARGIFAAVASIGVMLLLIVVVAILTLVAGLNLLLDLPKGGD